MRQTIKATITGVACMGFMIITMAAINWYFYNAREGSPKRAAMIVLGNNCTLTISGDVQLSQADDGEEVTCILKFPMIKQWKVSLL